MSEESYSISLLKGRLFTYEEPLALNFLKIIKPSLRTKTFKLLIMMLKQKTNTTLTNLIFRTTCP